MARLVAAVFLSFTLAGAKPPLLDLPKAVVLENVAWKVGDATLRIEKGWAAPFASKDGKPIEFAFVGRATLECAPSERVEASYLSLFTGTAALSLEVDAAALVLGDPNAADPTLVGTPATDDPEGRRGAERFAKWWLASIERRGLEVDLVRWRAAFGDPVVGRFRGLVVRSARLGAVCLKFDAESRHPFLLGRFVPPRLGDHTLDQVRRHVRPTGWEDATPEFKASLWGTWEIWVSSDSEVPPGEPQTDGRGYSIESYGIDLRIPSRAGPPQARTELRFRWNQAGRTTVQFWLRPEFVVRSVTAPDGRSLLFRREGSILAVALASPSVAGETRTLTVGYEGPAQFRDPLGDSWLSSDVLWFPTGGAPTAGWDVTVRRPANVDLFSVGSLVDRGEADGEIWERRVLDGGMPDFPIEVGKFDIVAEDVDGIELTFAFGRSPRAVPEKARKVAISLAKDALRTFAAQFGGYRTSALTFLTIPRSTSHSRPGLITLAHSVVSGDPRLSPEYNRALASETIAHEIVHQWFGNAVDTASYRDAWLSEALAELFSRRFTHPGPNRDLLYDRLGVQYEDLDRGPPWGRPLGDLGPVTLGTRLDSSYAAAAAPIVYWKGSLVLNALLYEIGEETFLRALRRVGGDETRRFWETRDLFDAMEKEAGRDLGPFYRTFVEGTVRPRIEVDRMAGSPTDDGRWHIQGHVRVIPDQPPPVVVRKDASGRWAVSPIATDTPPALEIPRLVVPWSARAGDADPPKRMEGTVALPVPAGTIEILVDDEPLDFRLNPMRSVYAAAIQQPAPEGAYGQVVLGRRRLRDGWYAEAAGIFGSVLESPLGPGPDEEIRGRVRNGCAHIGLARIALDRGDDAGARAHLADAEALLGPKDRSTLRDERALLSARLELREGKAGAAYDRLEGTIHIPFRQYAGESTAEQLRRRRFAVAPYGTAEAYAVLALAAQLTNHSEVAAASAREAARRGADLSAFPW